MKITNDPRQLDIFGDAEFGMVPVHYSIGDLRRCAEREVRLRKRVYPNRVLTRRLSAKGAETEIAKMQAIADYFAALEGKR